MEINDGSVIWTVRRRGGSGNAKTVIDLTMALESWVQGDENTYTIAHEAIKADSVIFLDVPVGTTVSNYVAVNAAQLVAKSQTDGQLVLQALGVMPNVDLSVTLTIL